jgi:hypothetical protein
MEIATSDPMRVPAEIHRPARQLGNVRSYRAGGARDRLVSASRSRGKSGDEPWRYSATGVGSRTPIDALVATIGVSDALQTAHASDLTPP